MPYKWQENAESSGGPTIPKGGPHRCRIVKVATGDDKGSFVTHGGDPQVVLTLQDQSAHEARMWITCSDKAGWVLAKLLGCFNPPANLARLEADGIDPAHFANQAFADQNLLNREVYIMMEEQTKDGKTKLVPVPVKPPAGAPTPSTPPVSAPTAPTAPSAPPTPPTAPTVTCNTKDEAWAHVWNQWAASGKDAQRDESWVNAIQRIGKDESQFTPADWTKVANSAGVPF